MSTSFQARVASAFPGRSNSVGRAVSSLFKWVFSFRMDVLFLRMLMSIREVDVASSSASVAGGSIKAPKPAVAVATVEVAPEVAQKPIAIATPSSSSAHELPVPTVLVTAPTPDLKSTLEPHSTSLTVPMPETEQAVPQELEAPKAPETPKEPETVPARESSVPASPQHSRPSTSNGPSLLRKAMIPSSPAQSVISRPVVGTEPVFEPVLPREPSEPATPPIAPEAHIQPDVPAQFEPLVLTVAAIPIEPEIRPETPPTVVKTEVEPTPAPVPVEEELKPEASSTKTEVEPTPAPVTVEEELKPEASSTKTDIPSCELAPTSAAATKEDEEEPQPEVPSTKPVEVESPSLGETSEALVVEDTILCEPELRSEKALEQEVEAPLNLSESEPTPTTAVLSEEQPTQETTNVNMESPSPIASPEPVPQEEEVRPVTPPAKFEQPMATCEPSPAPTLSSDKEVLRPVTPPNKRELSSCQPTPPPTPPIETLEEWIRRQYPEHGLNSEGQFIGQKAFASKLMELLPGCRPNKDVARLVALIKEIMSEDDDESQYSRSVGPSPPPQDAKTYLLQDLEKLEVHPTAQFDTASSLAVNQTSKAPTEDGLHTKTLLPAAEFEKPAAASPLFVSTGHIHEEPDSLPEPAVATAPSELARSEAMDPEEQWIREQAGVIGMGLTDDGEPVSNTQFRRRVIGSYPWSKSAARMRMINRILKTIFAERRGPGAAPIRTVSTISIPPSPTTPLYNDDYLTIDAGLTSPIRRLYFTYKPPATPPPLSPLGRNNTKLSHYFMDAGIWSKHMYAAIWATANTLLILIDRDATTQVITAVEGNTPFVFRPRFAPLDPREYAFVTGQVRERVVAQCVEVVARNVAVREERRAELESFLGMVAEVEGVGGEFGRALVRAHS
ncbi:hypothetical protein EDC01DRAFT_632378 [Geopyxis carbonaria]|nr:hypothetical protein EDC01DRAFT_632378 [Geopyxis carbonaria]